LTVCPTFECPFESYDLVCKNGYVAHYLRVDLNGKSRRQVKMLKQDFDDDKRNLKVIWKSIWRTSVFMFKVIL